MYNSIIGLISLGAIGRMAAERLRAFDVKVIAHDPYVDPLVAARLDVELCPLEDVFCRADVVSCHTPWFKETEGLVAREHPLSMKPGATFINTARGAVVDEAGMIAALRERPDLQALLDVTWPIPHLRRTHRSATSFAANRPHSSSEPRERRVWRGCDAVECGTSFYLRQPDLPSPPCAHGPWAASLRPPTPTEPNRVILGLNRAFRSA